MSQAPATLGPQRQRQQNIFQGILSGGKNILQGVGDIARDTGEFLRQNPEAVGAIGGAIIGGPIFAGAGLLQGVRARQIGEARQKKEIERTALLKAQGLRTFKQTVVKDQVLQKVDQTLFSASQARQLLVSGNPVATASIEFIFPRLLGEVGALTEGDRVAFRGSKAIFEKMEQIAEQMISGNLTTTNKTYMEDLIDILESNAAKTGNSRINVLSESEEGTGAFNRNEIDRVTTPLRFGSKGQEAINKIRERRLKEIKSSSSTKDAKAVQGF